MAPHSSRSAGSGRWRTAVGTEERRHAPTGPRGRRRRGLAGVVQAARAAVGASGAGPGARIGGQSGRRLQRFDGTQWVSQQQVIRAALAVRDCARVEEWMVEGTGPETMLGMRRHRQRPGQDRVEPSWLGSSIEHRSPSAAVAGGDGNASDTAWGDT